MSWQVDGVVARPVAGGLWIAQDGYGLLLDAPIAVSLQLNEVERASLGTVALSGGRMASVGGLVPLLACLEPHRIKEIPLALVAPLSDDRGPRLAQAWSLGWPGRYAIQHDAIAPGEPFDAGPFEVQTMSLVRGEPRWRPQPEVLRTEAMGFRIGTRAGDIAFIPGARPGRAVERLCEGARLAVIEVATEHWPASKVGWRHHLTDAMRLRAEEIWPLDESGQSASGREQ